jgi:hypothetical protein
VQPNEALAHLGAVAIGIQEQLDVLLNAQASVLSAATAFRPGITRDELLHLGAEVVNTEVFQVTVEPVPSEPSAPTPATTAQEPQTAPLGDAAAGVKPKPSADKPETASLSGSSVAGRQAVREKIGTRTATPPSSKPKSNGSGHGLAKSPIPRADMGVQRREREERLDKIVQWIIDHGGSSDALTIARAWDDSDESLRNKLGEDLRELARRGVLEAGDMIHPAFKEGMLNKGRTTREYHVPTRAAVGAS